jgi:hypothetical protein
MKRAMAQNPEEMDLSQESLMTKSREGQIETLIG